MDKLDNNCAIWYNWIMQRVVYYVISATSDENQRGIFHYSKPFNKLWMARANARTTRGELLEDGHVAIEKHHEVYEHNEWRIDHEGGGSEMVEYC